MWLVVSNRMSKRTHSQDSNSKLEKKILAKKCDDFIFENRNFDGTVEESPLK